MEKTTNEKTIENILLDSNSFDLNFVMKFKSNISQSSPRIKWDMNLPPRNINTVQLNINMADVSFSFSVINVYVIDAIKKRKTDEYVLLFTEKNNSAVLTMKNTDMVINAMNVSIVFVFILLKYILSKLPYIK